MDQISSISNIIYMCTSIHSAQAIMSTFEYVCIILDLLLIAFFMRIIHQTYLKHKDKNIKKIENEDEQRLMAGACYMQKGNELKFPCFIRANSYELARVLMIFVFQDYEEVFGIVFICLNVGIIGLWIHLLATERSKHKPIAFEFYIASQIFESLAFLTFGVLAINNKSFINNSTLIMFQGFCLVAWLMVSFCLTLVMLILRCGRLRTLRK